MNRKVGGSHNVKRMLSSFPPPPPPLHLAPSALSTTYLPPCDTRRGAGWRDRAAGLRQSPRSVSERGGEQRGGEEEEEEGRDTTPLSAAEWQGGTKEKLF